MKGRYKRFNFHNRSEITLIDIDSSTEKDYTFENFPWHLRPSKLFFVF